MKEVVSSAERNTKFEADLEEYLKAVVAIEKSEYNSPLQPFTAKEREIRQKLGSAFRQFRKSYQDGYRALVEELKHEVEMSETKEDLLALVQVDAEKRKLFQDPAKFMDALTEGSSIFELLGYSERMLQVSYAAVIHLIEAKEFTKARDILGFLVVIAPQVYQFWLAYGRCHASLDEYEIALQLFSQAIDMDPTQPVAYLNIIDLYLSMHDFEKATGVCNDGIRFATEYQDEPWSVQLREALEERLQVISDSLPESKDE